MEATDLGRLAVFLDKGAPGRGRVGDDLVKCLDTAYAQGCIGRKAGQDTSLAIRIASSS